jgi:hypothetical protein
VSTQSVGEYRLPYWIGGVLAYLKKADAEVLEKESMGPLGNERAYLLTPRDPSLKVNLSPPELAFSQMRLQRFAKYPIRIPQPNMAERIVDIVEHSCAPQKHAPPAPKKR